MLAILQSSNVRLKPAKSGRRDMQNANDFSLFKLQTEYLRTYYIYNKFYTIKGSKQQPVNSLKTIFLKTLNIQNHSKSMR